MPFFKQNNIKVGYGKNATSSPYIALFKRHLYIDGLCDNNRSLRFSVCAATVVHTFLFLGAIMKRPRAPWTEETAFLYIEEYQKNIPEEYKITRESERQTAIMILSAFCQTPPINSFKDNFRKLSVKDYLFTDLYNFFYSRTYKKIIDTADMYSEKYDVTQHENKKDLIIYISPNEVVLLKLKLIVCEYLKNSKKAKHYQQEGEIGLLKELIITKKSIFTLPLRN